MAYVPPRHDVTRTTADIVPPKAESWDIDALLTMEMIREHTKTDDIPRVTDAQLSLYRRAAIEAAERYTGLMLSGQRVIIEDVASPNMRAINRGWFTHVLKYPSATGMVFLYGSHQGLGDKRVHVSPGAKEIRVPVVNIALDVSSCCDPCSAGLPTNYGIKVMYLAGYSCKEEIPAGILLGCLKFIAWTIENPGDELMTVRNRLAGEATGIDGSNNAAWASGAIEQWRIYVDDAI